MNTASARAKTTNTTVEFHLRPLDPDSSLPPAGSDAGPPPVYHAVRNRAKRPGLPLPPSPPAADPSSALPAAAVDEPSRSIPSRIGGNLSLGRSGSRQRLAQRGSDNEKPAIRFLHIDDLLEDPSPSPFNGSSTSSSSIADRPWCCRLLFGLPACSDVSESESSPDRPSSESSSSVSTVGRR